MASVIPVREIITVNFRLWRRNTALQAIPLVIFLNLNTKRIRQVMLLKGIWINVYCAVVVLGLV